MPDATNAERTATYDAMNETLARLHRFDPNAIGLSDYGKSENYMARHRCCCLDGGLRLHVVDVRPVNEWNGLCQFDSEQLHP